MYRIHNCIGTSRNFKGLVQLEWSQVPWASGVVRHLATPEMAYACARHRVSYFAAINGDGAKSCYGFGMIYNAL